MSAHSLKELRMESRDWAALVFLSLLWGVSYLFMEVLVDYLRPFTIVAVRVTLAAAILNVYLGLKGQPLKFPLRMWASFLVMGVLGSAVPFTLIVWSQIYVTANLAAILTATVPFFAVTFAHFFTRDERLRVHKFLGVVLGFFGVVIIIGPGALTHIGQDVLAQLAVLLSTALYAMAAIYAKRFAGQGVSSIQVATGQLTTSAVLLVPLSLCFDRPWEASWTDPVMWGALLGIGILSTALALAVYYGILARAGATNVVLVTFLIPVSTIILSAVFFAEWPLPQQVLGMGVIGGGLAIIDGRLARKLRFRQV